MHYIKMGAGGGTLAALVGESFRLTTGVLTIITLVAGFATAVIVAFINTRNNHKSGDGKEVVSLPLERWAAERMSLQDAEIRALREENSQLKEKLWLIQHRWDSEDAEGTSGTSSP